MVLMSVQGKVLRVGGPLLAENSFRGSAGDDSVRVYNQY
jgi:hypothetical protein